MKEAMLSLSNDILKIQGDGDYKTTINLINEKGVIFETLDKDLKRLGSAGIPKDIVFEQGLEVLGL